MRISRQPRNWPIIFHKHDLPFRHAHDVVGSLVGNLYRKGENFENREFCFKHLQECGIKAPKEEVEKVLNSKQVMLSYDSLGGTGKKAVQKMLKEFNEELAGHRKVLEADKKRVKTAYEASRSLAAEMDGVSHLDQFKAIIQKYRPKK